jgi:hypothetical protein
MTDQINTIDTPVSEAAALPKAAAKSVTKRSESKKVLALNIYATKIVDGKEAVIASFMQDLAMSKAGATTYFYNCKKLSS